MPSRNKKFIFQRLAVVVPTAVATVVTILLGVLQIFGWITENAPWTLWVFIVVLIIFMFLLAARFEAVTEEAKGVAEAKSAEAAKLEAQLAKAVTRASEAEAKLTRLSERDQQLADQLWEYASDLETLTTLGEFFPYQIPKGTVRAMEALARLPMTRRAHDTVLKRQLDTLSTTAGQWVLELTQLVAPDGDFYSTRLEDHASGEVRKRHKESTDALGDLGLDLHEKFLAYQGYYASLQIFS